MRPSLTPISYGLIGLCAGSKEPQLSTVHAYKPAPALPHNHCICNSGYLFRMCSPCSCTQLLVAWSGLPGLWSGLWSGLVWPGLVWSGLVWSGLVWFGLVWSGPRGSSPRTVCTAVNGLSPLVWSGPRGSSPRTVCTAVDGLTPLVWSGPRGLSPRTVCTAVDGLTPLVWSGWSKRT